MSQAATAIFIALFTLSAVASVVIATVRIWRHLRERRRANRAAQPRRALLALAAANNRDEQEAGLRHLMQASHSQWRAAEPIAFELLAKVRGEARIALAEAFRRRGLITRAQRHLRATSPVRRARAANVLGSLGESAVVPELCRLLGDSHPDVRIAAVQALGRLGDPGGTSCLLASLRAHDPAPSQLVAHALIQIGLPAIAELKSALNSESALTRATVLDALRLLGAAEAEQQVIQVLASDPAVDVRYRAAATLGRIGGPAALAPLVAAATDTDAPARVRTTAAHALGELGDPSAAPALAALLDTSEHRLGGQAASALLRLGPAGVNALDRAAAGTGDRAAHARQALALAELDRRRAELGPRQRPTTGARAAR